MSNSIEVRRVLYVEDSPAEAMLLDVALREHSNSLELTVLVDGEKALDFISTKPFLPSVIVLDIHLPLRDGVEVLQALRADPYFKEVPVMVFVQPDHPAAKRVDDLKADLRLAKPFDLDGYQDIAHAIFQLSQNGRLMGAPSH